jgi:hypothetical protein
VDESLRDQSLESLTQLLRQLADEAKERKCDRLEVFSTLATEAQQWLVIAALHLKAKHDMITVTVLAGKEEESPIAALRKAADRVIASDRELDIARQTKTIVLEPEIERAKTIEQIAI